MSDDIVMVSAVRTPVGAFNGTLGTLPAHDLGKVAIAAALERVGTEPASVSEVIMGQILTAGQGQNPARQASVAAGIPVEVPAWGVNQLCGSGLRAVALGYQAITNGDSDIVVAGGQESMTQAPPCAHLRNGTKMGSPEFIDTMLKDGLGIPSRAITGGRRPKTCPASGRSRATSRTNSQSARRTKPKPLRRPA